MIQNLVLPVVIYHKSAELKLFRKSLGQAKEAHHPSAVQHHHPLTGSCTAACHLICNFPGCQAVYGVQQNACVLSHLSTRNSPTFTSLASLPIWGDFPITTASTPLLAGWQMHMIWAEIRQVVGGTQRHSTCSELVFKIQKFTIGYNSLDRDAVILASALGRTPAGRQPHLQAAHCQTSSAALAASTQAAGPPWMPPQNHTLLPTNDLHQTSHKTYFAWKALLSQ